MAPGHPSHPPRRIPSPGLALGQARSLTLVLGLFLLIPGCDSILGPATGSGPGPVVPITELPRELSSAEVETIRASNAFGFQLLRGMAGEEPGSSVFLSPLSAGMALGMTLNGADGATFQAMRSTLGFEGLSQEEINASYRGILDLLTGLDPHVETAVANAIWHRLDVPVRQSFRERVEASFDARIEGLDFTDPGAADRINAWVRGATNDRIDEMVEHPLRPDLVALLLNAVYFNGGWTEPFDRDLTRSAPFHLDDGTTAQVELMLRDDTLSHHLTERYAAVDLPYAGGAFSMTVVVPRGQTSLEELLTEADPTWWSQLTGSLTTSRALVQLPRFELEWEGELNDVLKAMGMEVAFQPGAADFSRMFESAGVWIDEVKQKSFIRVDEEGTEAAAVTQVAMPSSLPPEIRADRPFLLALRERLTGTILFLGAIREAPSPPS